MNLGCRRCVATSFLPELLLLLLLLLVFCKALLHVSEEIVDSNTWFQVHGVLVVYCNDTARLCSARIYKYVVACRRYIKDKKAQIGTNWKCETGLRLF